MTDNGILQIVIRLDRRFNIMHKRCQFICAMILIFKHGIADNIKSVFPVEVTVGNEPNGLTTVDDFRLD